MLLAFEVVIILLTAVTMSMALAHALEFPGKLRLDERTYKAVQTIYYPGFTVAGIAEPASAIATLILLLIAPSRGAAFWWILTAFIALAATHAIFWFVTQPTNRHWLRNQEMGKAGARFFDVERMNRESATKAGQPNWKQFRDRWEYSHIVRAALSTVALLSLVVGIR